MRYGLSEKQLKEIIQIFSSYKEIDKAILFGSRAKETHKESSDVDIVIKGNNITHSIIGRLQSNFEDTDLPYFFDIIAYKTITSEELKEHIRIYGKTIMSVHNNIPNGWRDENLVSCLEIVIDYRGKTPKKSESGILTLSAKSVKMGYIDYSKAYYILKETYDDFMVRGFPKVGDVLMTTEAPLGYIAKLDRDDVAIAQRLLTLRGKKDVLDNDYLRYYLTSRRGQYELQSRASGTTVQGIRRTEFEKVDILLPELEEQKSIAKILTAFDDKIENLQAQNKTLENIGQTIFKEWFGRYKNEDFEYSENVLEFKKGIEVGSKNYFDDKKILESPKRFYRVGDIAYNGKQANIFTEEKFLKNKTFEKKDILISFDGTIGRVFVGGAGGYSTGIRKVYSKEKFNYIRNSFIYFWGKSKNIQETIKLYSEGTTIQHAGKSIKYLKIISDKESILEVQKQLTPIFEKILLNLKQIQTLQQTRDTLLPKLMSGKIRIRNYEK